MNGKDDGMQQTCTSGIPEMKKILYETDDSITDKNELMKIVLVAMKGRVNPAMARMVIEEYLLTKQQP